MNTTKISIILPVYNVEKYLSKCLDSIINQTLRDIEIICINDGSTDNSLSILKEYALKDNRIKIIDIPNRGCGYARKIGLKEANGEYILLCDSDDNYSYNDAFFELYNKIKETNVDLLLFDYYLVKNANQFYKTPNVPEKKNFNYTDCIEFYFIPVTPWFKCYKKSFLDKYQDWYLPEENVVSGDVPLHYQVMIRAETISYLDKPIYTHYIRKYSLQRKIVTEKTLQNYCKHIQAINKLIKEECSVEKIKKYIIKFFFMKYSRLIEFLIKSNGHLLKDYETAKNIKSTCLQINETVSNIDISEYLHSDKDALFFYKLALRLPTDKYIDYLNKRFVKSKILEFKKLKDELIKEKNEQLQQKNEQIEKRDEAIKQKNSEIQNLLSQTNIQDQVIKRLQNSWSYRIGRLFTYPLSIFIDFYKYIRDYNLIKKSGLFDKEYYLSQNEDVKNAKMNPIKHYLQFGWKEGRNPSLEFDGNEYLNNRPDVRVAGLCPLVHHIKFGKEEK